MAAIRAGGLISLVGILSGTSTKVNLFKLIQVGTRKDDFFSPHIAISSSLGCALESTPPTP